MNKFDDLFSDEFEVTVIQHAREFSLPDGWIRREVILKCHGEVLHFTRQFIANFFPAEEKPSYSDTTAEKMKTFPKQVRNMLDEVAKSELQGCAFQMHRQNKKKEH